MQDALSCCATKIAYDMQPCLHCTVLVLLAICSLSAFGSRLSVTLVSFFYLHYAVVLVGYASLAPLRSTIRNSSARSSLLNAEYLRDCFDVV